LLRAMEQLAEASLEMRRNAPLAEAIVERILLSLAASTRKWGK
jgi:DNA polymerase-3 subunit delta